MITFSSFLAEAEFSEENFKRLLIAFEKRMPKLLGVRLHRYGGTHGVEKLPGGAQGYLYFLGNTRKAFRIRVHTGKLLGIDVWKQYTSNKGPVLSANVSAISAGSILSAMSKIAAVIKNPSATKIRLAKEVSENLQLDEMAKRTSPADFHALMIRKYGEQTANSATVQQIKDVAATFDVNIPGSIWKTGHGKPKRFNTNPNDSVITSDDSATDSAETPQEANINFEPADPNNKKYISVADVSVANKIFAQANKAANGPPTEVELKDPETLYGHMAQLVQMACKGTLRSLLIYGGPGTGKCFFGSTPIEVLTKDDLI